MPRDNFDRQTIQPVNYTGLATNGKLDDLLVKDPSIRVVDQYIKQLEELFLLRHPEYRFNKNYQLEFEDFLKEYLNNKKIEQSGEWFYFPWSNYLVHFLPEKEHFELRTGRNKNLITASEQEKYYNSCIGILGMSVGSHAVLTIVMTGGAKYLKIADLDIISGSNLNRIRTGFQNLGLNKVIAVARKVYEINPYSEIYLYTDGLSEENFDDFLRADKPVDLLVEEMDNPYLKIKIREESKKLSIPVIMAADNGDGVIVDVERFDMDGNYPLLHDIIKNVKSDDLKNEEPRQLPQRIAEIAGAKFASKRMLESVSEVGKTLYSWPQLGTAATMCGSVLAGLARRIVLKDKTVQSGRFVINPEKIFTSVNNLNTFMVES